MLYYTLMFLLIAFIAGVLGFGVVAGIAAFISKALFLVFLTMFLISLAGQLTTKA